MKLTELQAEVERWQSFASGLERQNAEQHKRIGDLESQLAAARADIVMAQVAADSMKRRAIEKVQEYVRRALDDYAWAPGVCSDIVRELEAL